MHSACLSKIPVDHSPGDQVCPFSGVHLRGGLQRCFVDLVDQRLEHAQPAAGPVRLVKHSGTSRAHSQSLRTPGAAWRPAHNHQRMAA